MGKLSHWGYRYVILQQNYDNDIRKNNGLSDFSMNQEVKAYSSRHY